MKRICIFFFILVLSACQANAQETMEKKFDVNKGERLEIDIDTGGSVKIEGWNKDEVFIKAISRYRDLDEYDIRIEQRSGRVIADVREGRYYRRYRNDRSGLTFEVKVPEKYDVDVETMGGDIYVRTVEGDIRGKTMGGELDLSNLKGRIRLTTMGGDVNVRDSELDGSISTMGGEVLVENVSGDLDASSMGGKIIQKNVKDRSGKSTGGEVRISTMGGPIRIQDAPEGADLNTMGGDIRVRSAKKYVKAKTMGGDIEIDELDGRIDGVTYGGDIIVRMIGYPGADRKDIELESLSGDIEVTVPEDFSMDVFIEIEYTRRSRRNFRIVSDFKIDIKESEDWERSRRSDDRWNRRESKFITGKAEFKGGKNKVTLKTINGNIYLKKGK